MVSKENGRIILIASGQRRHGTKKASSYVASKWGVIGPMKSAALELGEHQITVNCIEPGLTDTLLTRNPTRFKAAIGEVEHTRNPRQTLQRIRSRATCREASDAQYDVTAGDSANYTA